MSSEFKDKHEAISALQRAFQTRDFQANRIRQAAEESKQRWRDAAMSQKEEILERLADLSKKEHSGKTGWITEEAIKKDPILILADVRRLFGNVVKARQATRQKLDGTYVPEEPNPLGALSVRAQDEAAEGKKKAEAKARALEREEEKKAALKRGEEPPRKKPGRQRSAKPDDELFDELLEKSRSLGQVITDPQIKEDPNLCSPHTYLRYLGKGYKDKIRDILVAEGIITEIEPAAKPAEKSPAKKKPAKKAPAKKAVAKKTPVKKAVVKKAKVAKKPKAKVALKKVAPKPKVKVVPKKAVPQPKPLVKATPEVVIPQAPAKPTTSVASVDVRSIPFQLIVPKDVKGTISINLTLEF